MCKVHEEQELLKFTLFPSGVNRIMVTLAPEPGGIWVETGRGLPNSHITTEPSIQPVRSEQVWGRNITMGYC